MKKIKGHWYEEEDLETVLRYFGASVPMEFIEVATPQDDWVKAECAEDGGKGGSYARRRMFDCHECGPDCKAFEECKLKNLSDEARGWHRYAEVEEEFDRLRIPKSNLFYMNADYGNNMFFHNNSFLGEHAEKEALRELFCQTQTEVFLDNGSEWGDTRPVPNLIEAVLSLDVGEALVAFVGYAERRSDGGRTHDSAQKAIYRMCCIGFVDDFTHDYARRQFRLVMRRKPDGGYYEGLRRFLSRYYADERAGELAARARSHSGENEVRRCLDFLTEFIYDKVAVKRKRALDDVRTFCAIGTETGADWKEANEDLKDFIYYYFNSKYAREGFASDAGEPFSLTDDTDWGKRGDAETALKYLRVVEEDLVGAGGTPIDNVKHLQGAVRLIRRSLTDANPCLELLNYFCLTQLGTNGSDALERELLDGYRSGMEGFAERLGSMGEFWRFKRRFDEAVEAAPHRYDLGRMEGLQGEMAARIHLAALKRIRRAYVGDERKEAHDE